MLLIAQYANQYNTHTKAPNLLISIKVPPADTCCTPPTGTKWLNNSSVLYQPVRWACRSTYWLLQSEILLLLLLCTELTVYLSLAVLLEEGLRGVYIRGQLLNPQGGLLLSTCPTSSLIQLLTPSFCHWTQQKTGLSYTAHQSQERVQLMNSVFLHGHSQTHPTLCCLTLYLSVVKGISRLKTCPPETLNQSKEGSMISKI